MISSQIKQTSTQSEKQNLNAFYKITIDYKYSLLLYILIYLILLLYMIYLLNFFFFRVLAGEKLWEEKARAYHLSHRPTETSNEEAASSTAPVAWPRVILLDARNTYNQLLS